MQEKTENNRRMQNNETQSWQQLDSGGGWETEILFWSGLRSISDGSILVFKTVITDPLVGMLYMHCAYYMVLNCIATCTGTL